MARKRLSADTGGTFIDFVLLDEESGDVVFEKEPAVASSRTERFLAGVARLPVPVKDVGHVSHGTTVAINAILEERGDPVGLITTQGFRDVLGIGRGARTDIYNFSFQPPRPLVPRRMRVEVEERVDGTGRIVKALRLDDLRHKVDGLIRDGAQALCIAFLNSYINPSHERQAAEAIREWYDVPVTASSEVAREWREFERTSTAVLNAFVQGEVGDYLSCLKGKLGAEGYRGTLAVMQSNGGIFGATRAAQLPIRTLASGPAGGVIGAQVLAERTGRRNVITADVGGTSFDVALIEDGVTLEKPISYVAGRPVVGSALDIVSIGTGGGSIAWVDDRGSIRVGPRSAGAQPGPACFAAGGTEPTVTDCQLLLGRLRPEGLLGSRIKLDRDLAERAVTDTLCASGGLSVDEAAGGVLRIAETSMAYAIRALTVERGRDPRDYSMVSYGGAGGFFAAAVADELEIMEIVVPRAPANFSAWGLLHCDYREDVSLTTVELLDDGAAVSASLLALGNAALGRVCEHGFDPSLVEIEFQLDLRYVGQEHTLRVVVEPMMDSTSLIASAREGFVGSHRRSYGHGAADAPIEIVTLRASGIARVDRPELSQWSRRVPPTATSRSVGFPEQGGHREAQVLERDGMATGDAVEGPAIIEEWTSTTVVPPGWCCRMAQDGSLELTRVDGR